MAVVGHDGHRAGGMRHAGVGILGSVAGEQVCAAMGVLEVALQLYWTQARPASQVMPGLEQGQLSLPGSSGHVGRAGASVDAGLLGGLAGGIGGGALAGEVALAHAHRAEPRRRRAGRGRTCRWRRTRSRRCRRRWWHRSTSRSRTWRCSEAGQHLSENSGSRQKLPQYELTEVLSARMTSKRTSVPPPVLSLSLSLADPRGRKGLRQRDVEFFRRCRHHAEVCNQLCSNPPCWPPASRAAACHPARRLSSTTSSASVSLRTKPRLSAYFRL
jgi:hypothetical protein